MLGHERGMIARACATGACPIRSPTTCSWSPPGLALQAIQRDEQQRPEVVSPNHRLFYPMTDLCACIFELPPDLYHQ